MSMIHDGEDSPFDEVIRLPTGTGAFKNDLVLFVWFGEADLKSIDFAYEYAENIRDPKTGNLAALVLVSEGATLPNRAQREAFAQMWKDIPPSGVATFIEVPGLLATATRSVMSVISTLSRSRDTFRTFKSLNDAAVWLSARCSLSPGHIVSLAKALPREPLAVDASASTHSQAR